MSDATRYRAYSQKLENAVGKSARDDGESYLTMVVLSAHYDRDIQARDETIARLTQFIRNGVEYGYITVPEKGDPAREVIDAALKEQP